MIPNSDLQKWQQAIKGIETAKNNLSSEELSAIQALTKLIDNDNFEANESRAHIRVIKNLLPQHSNNRLLKVHLTNVITLYEKYFQTPVETPKTVHVSKPEQPAQDRTSKMEQPSRIRALQPEQPVQDHTSKVEQPSRIRVSQPEPPVQILVSQPEQPVQISVPTSEPREKVIVPVPEQPKIEYYYYKDREEKGPIGIDQLKEVGLSPNTLVWRKGLAEWKRAKEVEELGSMFNKPQPPEKPQVKMISDEESKRGRTGLKKALIISGVVVIGLAALAGGYFMLKDSNLFSGKKETDTIDYSFIPASSNDQTWGYINRNSEYEINPQYYDADFFSDGLAKVKSDEGKIGYINKNGEYVIPPIYKNGTAFKEGLAFVVEEGGFPICIDKSGDKQFVMNEAKYVFAFSDGLAMFANEADKYGFVDKNGKTVIEAQFEMALPFIGDFAGFWQSESVGFIDKTGKTTIPPKFKEVGYFSEEKAPFFDGNQWGYIDTNGSYAIHPQFESAGQFKNGLASVQQGGMFGYVNKGGKMVIKPQFDDASSFSDGLAVIRVGEKYGYINKDGNTKINPQFEYAGNFHNGSAPVFNNGKWGLINKTGQYIANPLYSSIKLEVSPNIDEDLVESEYYDISEFFKWFFEKESGNTFDGINASTSLEELSNHPLYGAGLNAREDTRGNSYADCNQETKITNDISIRNILFYFDKPIYKVIETYNRGFRSTRKEIDLNTVLVEFRYELVLSGKAWDKRNTVVSALKTEIERHYGQQMQDGYFLKRDVGKLSFCIVDKGVILQLGVNFNGGNFN